MEDEKIHIDKSLLRDYDKALFLNPNFTKESSDLATERMLGYIESIFDVLDRLNKFKDKTKDYLDNLEKDCKGLSNIKTHNHYFKKLKEGMEYEQRIGKEYIKNFRIKINLIQRYTKYLLFLLLVHRFKQVRYKDFFKTNYKIKERVNKNKPIEITAKICLFLENPNNYNNLNKKIIDKKCYIIKQQGLYRIKNIKIPFGIIHLPAPEFRKKGETETISIKELLRTKGYHNYEKWRIIYRTKIIKSLQKQGKIGKNEPKKSQFEIKKYIEEGFIIQLLKELIEKELKEYEHFNVLELWPIIKNLKLPETKQKEISNFIENDLEFHSAFRNQTLAEDISALGTISFRL
jgi:hypothetical protein